MPHYTVKHLTDKAVIWSWDGEEVDDYGDPKVGAATEFSCRWENVDEEFTTADGSVIRIVANVIVNSEVPVGSIVYEGPLSNIVGTGTTDTIQNLKEVKAYTRVENIKGRHTRRILKLAKFHDTLPDLA
jgi:hypothetical protein